MKKIVPLLVMGLFPISLFAQKDSIAQLRQEITVLEGQMQSAQAKITKLEDKIPYYEQILKLQQLPIVQTKGGLELRLTKVYFDSKEKMIFIEGLITVKDAYKKSLGFYSPYIISPEGLRSNAYNVYNNNNTFAFNEVTQDVPYAFKMKFTEQKPIPKIALLQFEIMKQKEPFGMDNQSFEFKGITVE